MSRNSVFAIPNYAQYNPSITLARMFLSFFVFYGHSVFWYDYYFHEISPLLKTINLGLYKLLQGCGETNPGVIAFITISGYCIHRNGLRIDQWDLKKFFIRRFFRIYPMFLIGSILGAVVYYYLCSDPKIVTITYTKDLSLTAIIYKLSGLFAFIPWNFSQIAYQGNGPLMTCAVEVWLYIFYPLMALIALKRGDKALWWIIAAITILGVIAYTLVPELQSWWHNGSFFGFLIYWWIGVYAVDKDCVAKACKVFSYVKPLLGSYVALTILTFLTPKFFFIVEIRKIVFAILIGCLLRWLEERPLKKLYARSFFESGYSLYSLHTPLICLCLFFNFSFYGMWLSIFTLIYLSYVLIERPMINFGEAIRTPLLAATSPA